MIIFTKSEKSDSNIPFLESQQLDQELVKNSEDLFEKILSITSEAKQLPGEKGSEFNKKLQSTFTDMSLKLHKRDQIYLQSIEKHKKDALKLQQKNEKTIQSLSNKVIELTLSLSKFQSNVST